MRREQRVVVVDDLSFLKYLIIIIIIITKQYVLMKEFCKMMYVCCHDVCAVYDARVHNMMSKEADKKKSRFMATQQHSNLKRCVE